MKSFFKTCVSSMKTSGTIKPSSSKLIQTCLKKLDLETYNTIVELGPGDGCVTTQILSRIPKTSKFISIEINEDFYNHCMSRFKEFDNLILVKESAFELESILKNMDVHSVDCVISSLPLSLFKKQDVNALLQQVKRGLKPNGKFVQYQYSLANYNMIKKSFPKVSLDLTLYNIPPAFVYHCTI